MPHFAFYNGDPGFIIKAVSTSYSRRKFIVKHYLLDEIVNLDKLLFARENENNNIGDNQCQPYEQPPISPPSFFNRVSARVFSVTTGTADCINSNLSTASVTFDELCHNVLYQMTNSDVNNKDILIFAPLEQAICLWNLAALLRTLYCEGAYSRWPEINGYFLDGKEVMMKIWTKGSVK